MNNSGKHAQPGFLSRLRKDSRGNTLMLVGAAIVPLTGIIGAGVDISRTYLVKSRLQQACDAGALAGRKFLNSGVLDSAALTKSQNFFKSNFPTGAYGTSNIVFTPTLIAENEVKGVADARIPMTVMKMFGNKFTDIRVECGTKLDIGNTDVMMVLDVTNSMSSSLGSTTRIAAMKAAVINFYNTLGPGDEGVGRIRYGIVPYGQNVNVGYSLPSAYVLGGATADDWIYQTRVANMTTPDYVGVPATPTNGGDQTFGSSITQANCAKYGNNQSFTQGSIVFTGGADPLVTGGPAPAATTSMDHSNSTTAGPGLDWGWTGAPVSTGTNRTCRRHRTSTVTNYTLAGYKFAGWTYKQASVDITGYASGAAVNIYTGNPATSPAANIGRVPASGQYDLRSLVSTSGSTVTSNVTPVTWDGCIEEADTIDTITSSTPITSVPTGAYDLDIDLVPDSNEERWRPTFKPLIYTRSALADATTGTAIANYSCPADRARKLMRYPSITSAPIDNPSLTSFQNYINGLSLVGGTIHDIGFVWGARFLSGEGIFAAENPDNWSGQPVSRHIIFMTDGAMNAQSQRYIFHGYNEQAKAKNITVWVIAFAEGVAADYPDLLACASTSNHFKFAADADDLNTEFQNIATDIAQLRLTL
jgi:Flp pilus assembly protein TadG